MRPSTMLSAAAIFLSALALGAAGATAAPSPASQTASASLCSVSRSVAATIVRSTSINHASTPAYLKTFYGKLESAKPALIAAAHGTTKSDLRKVFGFIDLADADLKKADWQIARVVPYFPALVAKGKAVDPSLKRLTTYYRTTCHFKV